MSSTAQKGFTKGSVKQQDVRSANIVAARSVASLIRTSLGPRGMDKLIQSPINEVTITNDGATIMQQIRVAHPAAKMMVELSKSQDVEAGDGTTSVVVLAGSLLSACQSLLERGIHATTIANAFLSASKKAAEVMRAMSVPLNQDLSTERDRLVSLAATSLSSKIVSQYSSKLAPLAADAVLSVIDAAKDTTVDLGNVRVVRKLGGTIADTALVKGLVFTQKAMANAGGPTNMRNARIGLIQYCLSPPKPAMDSQVHVSDYQQMDRIIKDNKQYLAKLLRPMLKAKCNVLLIQKSILRDAVTNESLQLLARKKILVIKDIERADVEFICKTLKCRPIADPSTFTEDKLGHAELVESVETSEGKVVKITGVANMGRTMSVLVRGSNLLALAEAERSLHDALCVVRSLVQERSLIIGGGAPEIEVSMQLAEYAKTLSGPEQYCVRAFAEAFEIIPYTLAENAGLNPIRIVTELRARHAAGDKGTGINVLTGEITDLLKANVVQPLLVNLSALRFAVETVAMILKIDDMVPTR